MAEESHLLFTLMEMKSNDSSSSGNLNATSLKMLLSKEMANEVEPIRSPSVIARLMGLEEDLPAKEPIIHHAKNEIPIDSKAVNKAQWKKDHQFIRLMTQDLQQFHEHKYGYKVCKDQSGTSFFEDLTPDKLWSSENMSDQSDTVQEKFVEAPNHTKVLQEHLKIPSSNKDFLLESPEECNSSLSRYPSSFPTNRAPPQTKHITVLKPVSSSEISAVRQSQTEQVNKQNNLKMGQFHQSASSNEETPSQSSRIIVLRPTPGKSCISKAKLTPRTTSFQLPECNNLNESAYNEAAIGASGLVHGVKQNCHAGCHQRDDFLLSSAHSSGYMGDESSCGDSEVGQSSDSEIEYIDEAGGSSDNCSPRKYSWNYSRGDEGPYSGSFLDVAHFPDSLINREAKKQLSEICATMNCDEICQEKQQSSRKKCTLGEMLSIQEAKTEDCTTGTLSVSTHWSCGMEKEPPVQSTHIATSRKDKDNPRKLPGANPAPVITSMLDNMAANVQLSNPESYKPKLVVISDKGKVSFKGRVSNFFLSTGKRPRPKTAYYTSDCCAERVAHSRLNHDLNWKGNQNTVDYGDKFDSYSMQTSTDMSERTASIGITVPLNCTSGNLDKLGVNEGLNSNPDQPSPTSVLNAPSEDCSCYEHETSGRSSKNATISKSSAVEAVACSLAWEATNSESHLLCIRRPPSLISDAGTDEAESHVLVQNIMSSSRLGGAQSSMAFTAGWHLPDYPLEPSLCNKILDLQEQSSHRRLLFDSANAALVEIDANALLSVFPCIIAHSRMLTDISAPDLRVEVWSILKDWIYGARMFAVSKKGSARITSDGIVKQEVEGWGWVKTMVAQVIDIAEELEKGVLEELVEEAVLEFLACFQH